MAIDASWVNIALPGISNTRILNYLEEFLDKIYLDSDLQLITVVTLTESGRHEEIQQVEADIKSLQQGLDGVLQKTYQRINSLRSTYPRAKFLVGHNFTDAVDYDCEILDRSWLEVMTDRSISNNTRVVVSEHIAQLNYQRRYNDTESIIDKALARVDVLDECCFTNKEDSRHPTQQGHDLWAQYLLGNL